MSSNKAFAKAACASSDKGVMLVEVKDALTLMISFGALIVALLTLVVSMVTAFNRNTKK